MPFTVVLTARALRDLQEARDYIRQSALETADRWYYSFLQALVRLEENPESRSLAPENREFDFDLRQFFFRTKGRLASRALFTIAGNEVRILAIRRPGQPLIAGDEI